MEFMMKLLQEICENVSNYDKLIEKIEQTIDRFDVEIALEKRLGLSINEADDYYTNGNMSTASSNDSIDFQATPGVAKPVINQGPAQQQRIHLIYDPQTQKVKDVMKTDIRGNPGSQFSQATPEQLDGAVKHMSQLKPDLASRIKNGQIAVWVPKDAQTSGARMLGMTSSAPVDRGNTVTRDIPADQLHNAWKASSKWTTT